ncbi:hypothetical protein PPSIR1_39160 [Plesiocystis pacifica SIR-1]|uniref:Uncharacterized protein n=1 Tax=Plesiocystis pacifica SIR-1 TaxID=391625 RepID=A6GJ05_9BACT|nr:hypothetical protein [Plesiocystis pacifica]EDM74161.1 hypothetical protein PPSIR1_39160 [Plesiocystis pacifica SIR-1]
MRPHAQSESVARLIVLLIELERLELDVKVVELELVDLLGLVRGARFAPNTLIFGLAWGLGLGLGLPVCIEDTELLWWVWRTPRREPRRWRDWLSNRSEVTLNERFLVFFSAADFDLGDRLTSSNPAMI